MIALSIRQPWAALVVMGPKDIENRTWPTKRRGRVLIHAAKNMSADDYHAVIGFLTERPSLAHVLKQLPKPDDLAMGSIIGAVDLVDCVSASRSPWYMGAIGFELANAREFFHIPFKGALGFFETGLEEH